MPKILALGLWWLFLGSWYFNQFDRFLSFPHAFSGNPREEKLDPRLKRSGMTEG
jgi:hypothetical protein